MFTARISISTHGNSHHNHNIQNIKDSSRPILPLPPSATKIKCWCGSEEDYNKYGEGLCDYPCPGDAQQTCGGYYAMSVYTYFA